MPFPASHRQLRVVTKFPIPLVSSTIAHLIGLPRLPSPLGLSRFPAWVSLRLALRMPSPPAGPRCVDVDETQPPARVCSLPPLRGDESCLPEGARRCLMERSCGEGGWQREALPLRVACFNPWETGARAHVGSCVPTVPSPMGWVMVCTFGTLGDVPSAQRAQGLKGWLASSQLALRWRPAWALHFAALPSGLTPLPLELTALCLRVPNKALLHPSLPRVLFSRQPC